MLKKAVRWSILLASAATTVRVAFCAVLVAAPAAEEAAVEVTALRVLLQQTKAPVEVVNPRGCL
jgi:hypothetical protein